MSRFIPGLSGAVIPDSGLAVVIAEPLVNPEFFRDSDEIDTTIRFWRLEDLESEFPKTVETFRRFLHIAPEI